MAAPQSKTENYTSLEYWTFLAKALARGGLDALFLADVLGFYDVSKETVDIICEMRYGFRPAIQ